MTKARENGARSRSFTGEERDKIIDMWKRGHGYATIGAELGRSSGSISSGIRRLASSGLVEPREKAPVIPESTQKTIVRMWNDGSYRVVIAREVDMSGDALDGIIRRMIVAGTIQARPKGWVVPSALREDLPPPKAPLAVAANNEDRYMQSARRGGAKSAIARGGATAKPPEVNVAPAARAITLYKGESGVELFPYPPGLEGTPLLGGVGYLPEPRHHLLCQWVTHLAPGGWRSTTFCNHAVVKGQIYCPGHHGMASVSLVNYRMNAPAT